MECAVLSYGDVGKLLAAGSADTLVLSLYVELPWYLPGLREVPDRVRGLLAAAADAADGQVSRQAAAAAERDVRKVLEGGARYWLGHGAGIFLGRPAGLAERIVLPAGLGERAVFASRPHVRPLLTALQRWPAYQVTVLTRQRAWLFAVDGEHIAVRNQGPAGWDWLGSTRVAERTGRFSFLSFRDAAAVLSGGAGGGDEGPLVIGGYPGAVPDFFAALPGSARERFAGSFAVDPRLVSPARIRDLAGPVVRHAAERSERELAARVRSGLPAGTAAAGLKDCLAAVNRDGVAVLAVPGPGLVPGFACRRCGALSVTPAGCSCGRGAAGRVPDLIEEMAVAVIGAGGTVRTADGLPGGVAACLRSPAGGRTHSAV
jgi:hypothetical protein